ncbi:hypothetical protein [Demequina soli]|uniref:hypothetical protein n=1 Tax=Demequina soli TaxID=1638987 RepID=UPI0007866CCD|nr:hypothetical protein [Demequina soli]
MARIDWQKISNRDFDDLVEALLVREFTGAGLVAQALDGRGGDGGIDVDIRARSTDQVIHVYQLKYFPEGFSAGFAPRRRQIKKSLKTAIDEVGMPAWTLVTPRKVTGSERKAVRKMRDGARVEVRFMGPPELDGLLSKHPDIEARFALDREVEILRAVNRESAALARPRDLADELGHLRAKLDARSEYWGTSFAVDARGNTVETLYAKRSDAQEREPLTLSATLEFGEADATVREAFEVAMKFGALEEVTLPPHVVKSFDRQGPGWFAGTERNAEVRISPQQGDHRAQRIRVIAEDCDGGTRSTLQGETVGAAVGVEGATVRGLFQGGVEITWRVPRTQGTRGKFSVDSDFTGQSAHRILRVIRFLDQLAAATRLGVEVDGSPAEWIDLPQAGRRSFSADNGDFVAFIEDLHYLEVRFDVEFALPPTGPTDADVIDARIARLFMEGHPCAERQDFVFNGTLARDVPDSVLALIRDGGAIVISDVRVVQSLLGATFEMGSATFYSPHAEVEDEHALLQAIERDTTAGAPIGIRPAGGLPWTIYSPAELDRRGDDTVQARPWAIAGLPEHSGFAKLPHARPEPVQL